MQKKTLIALIILLLTVSLISHLGYLGLRAEEPRRAIVSIEMYENGNLIVPTIHEETYYNKPPLYNWIIALFYFIFQSFDEWVVRLPGIIFYLLTGLLIYQTVKKHINQENAILSALFYLTSVDLLFYGTVNAGEIDIFYSFIVFWQAVVIFKYFHKQQYFLMYFLSYILTFVGLITKGIPSLAFQALTILAFVLYYRKWKLLFGWQHITGILTLVALTGGFLYLYSLDGNVQGFLTQQFAESSDKSFNEGSLTSTITTFFKFPVQLIIIALPWALLLPALLWRSIRTKIKSNKLIVFSIIFILSNIIIYWISPGVRNRYLYMFIPFLSILAAFIFNELTSTKKGKRIFAESFPQWGIGFLITALLVFPFFTKVSNHVEYKWLILSIFAIAFIGILFFSSTQKQNRILYLILAIALGRIWFNFGVLPYLESRSNGAYYEKHMNKINEITQNKQVFLNGDPIRSNHDLHLFGIDIEASEFIIPPKVPYAIPYYQYKNTGYVLSYDSIPKKTHYYLGTDSLIQATNIDTLYQFKEKWKNQNLILFKLKN